MVARCNFTIRSGNTGVDINPDGISLVLQSGGAIEDLTGSEFVFKTAALEGVFLRKTSADGGVIIDALAGSVIVPITLADSHALPAPCRVAFAIEQRTPEGAQRDRLIGQIRFTEGTNDDE